jgi:hypothetical protein
MRIALVVLALAAAARAAEPHSAALVVCAPGYPGTTAEAQGAMDALSTSLAKGAGLPESSLVAVYHEAEEPGLARLGQPDAAMALLPLAFFLKHEKELRLTARLSAVPKGGAALESWALVAKKGALQGAASLDGYTISSIAGFAPAFVRAAVASWGALPPGARVVQSGQVLSSLRKAAAGEKVAVLLDGAQAQALATLPFAAELETVATSPKMPTAIVATVGKRLPAAKWKHLAAAFEKLGQDPTGKAALETIRMEQFVPLDEAALSAARRAYAEAAK